MSGVLTHSRLRVAIQLNDTLRSKSNIVQLFGHCKRRSEWEEFRSGHNSCSSSRIGNACGPCSQAKRKKNPACLPFIKSHATAVLHTLTKNIPHVLPPPPLSPKVHTQNMGNQPFLFKHKHRVSGLLKRITNLMMHKHRYRQGEELMAAPPVFVGTGWPLWFSCQVVLTHSVLSRGSRTQHWRARLSVGGRAHNASLCASSSGHGSCFHQAEQGPGLKRSHHVPLYYPCKLSDPSHLSEPFHSYHLVHLDAHI